VGLGRTGPFGKFGNPDHNPKMPIEKTARVIVPIRRIPLERDAFGMI
jgi:hypothetical protein